MTTWTRIGCAAALAAAAVAAPAVTCRVELDRTVLPPGPGERAVVRVTLEPPPPPRRGERSPVNLAIVLDRSGSMSGEKIERAKDAAIEALRRLGPRDLFSLAIFDHEVETLVPPQSAARTEWIEPRIRSIQAHGNTALFAGVSQGAAEIRRHIEGPFNHRIILLSDGKANVGPSSPSDLGRFGAALMKERISVTTVGVGLDYNEGLMTQLAERSDGNTYFVAQSRDLPRIFAAELGDVLDAVAREVRVDLTFPDGVRPIRIVGRDGRLLPHGVEVALNQLYGGHPKHILVEVEVKRGRAGETIEFAAARVSYEDLIARGCRETAGRATARFSDDRREVEQSLNRDVRVELLRNWAGEARGLAIEQNDRNDPVGAARLLRANSERLREEAKRLDADDIAAEAARLEAAAAEVERRGMNVEMRKEFRSDSYQSRSQQRAR